MKRKEEGEKREGEPYEIVNVLGVGLERLSGRHVKVTDDLVDVNSAGNVTAWSNQKGAARCPLRPAFGRGDGKKDESGRKGDEPSVF
jgi:hypothetical protein